MMLPSMLPSRVRQSVFSWRQVGVSLLLSLVALVPTSRAQGTGYATLLSFGTSSDSGRGPFAGLTQGTDGLLYGTTQQGGGAGGGTVFSLTTGGTQTILHRFDGGDGAAPNAALIRGANGDFYGTTEDGGFYNGGTAFEVTTGGTVTVLHDFGQGNDGYAPEGSLVLAADGNFYGTASHGGFYGQGIVFRLAPDGTYTILYDFGTAIDDGAVPTSALVQGTDGNLYGTTLDGGYYDQGTVFQITLNGVLTILHDFQGSEGAQPDAALLQANDGNFYGTTAFGGPYNTGTVFRITTAGTLTTLASFGGRTDGIQPEAPLIQATDGLLYGTTEYGGDTGGGTVFSVTTDGGGFATLHSFNGGGTDGANPLAPVVQAGNGILYGTTIFGGTRRRGAAYQLDLALPAPTAAPAVTAAVKGRGTATFAVRNARFLISRTGGDLSTALTVGYTLSGTAVNGADYDFLDGAVTIPAGAASVRVPVAALHTVATPLTVTLTLTSPATGYTLGGSTGGTVEIAP